VALAIQVDQSRDFRAWPARKIHGGASAGEPCDELSQQRGSAAIDTFDRVEIDIELTAADESRLRARDRPAERYRTRQLEAARRDNSGAIAVSDSADEDVVATIL
jgi:hypothetical protein